MPARMSSNRVAFFITMFVFACSDSCFDVDCLLFIYLFMSASHLLYQPRLPKILCLAATSVNKKVSGRGNELLMPKLAQDTKQLVVTQHA
jgi:hypothetical protein